MVLLTPLPLRGAEPGSPAFDVIDLNVHLPHQSLAHGWPLSVGGGQAATRHLRRGGATGIVLPLPGALRAERSAPTLEVKYLSIARQLLPSSEFRVPGCRSRGSGIRTWLAIEGAAEVPASAVGLWMARGVRVFGLVRSEDNDLASSGRSPPPTLTGLTPVGRSLVRRIHAAGGIVDVSHASDMTIQDVVRLALQAKSPVVASHSNARAVTSTRRNLSDESLREIAGTGGVVGISFDRRLLATGHVADLSDVVKHVRHIARVAGTDHVAIGSGFDGGIRPPRALLNAGRYQRLAQAMLRAGWSRAEVAKLMSGNALRVLCPSARRVPTRGAAQSSSQAR